MSVPTISEWLNILEITSQIILVPPFFENFGKRLVKSPKIYFADSGLACYLLGIESERMLWNSPFSGPIFEGFIASEILKQQLNAGKRKEIYYFRDQQGLEVDFLIPTGNRGLTLIEAKASRTVKPDMANSLKRLQSSIANYRTKSYIIYRQSKENETTFSILPGIKAISVGNLGQLF